jgi:hypothetical protein
MSVEPTLTARDRARVALIDLELSILPHVESDAEVLRRLRRVHELRQGLPVLTQNRVASQIATVATRTLDARSEAI